MSHIALVNYKTMYILNDHYFEQGEPGLMGKLGPAGLAGLQVSGIVLSLSLT